MVMFVFRLDIADNHIMTEFSQAEVKLNFRQLFDGGQPELNEASKALALKEFIETIEAIRHFHNAEFNPGKNNTEEIAWFGKDMPDSSYLTGEMYKVTDLSNSNPFSRCRDYISLAAYIDTSETIEVAGLLIEIIYERNDIDGTVHRRDYNKDSHEVFLEELAMTLENLGSNDTTEFLLGLNNQPIGPDEIIALRGLILSLDTHVVGCIRD